MKVVIVGIALVSTSLLAYADGPPQQYEQAAVNQAALDPGESVINDDGAKEDPNAKMTGTARAYRNGYYNGKNAQREQDASSSPPPLPSDVPTNQRWAQIPPQPHAPVSHPQPQQYAPRVPGPGDAGFNPQQWVNAQMGYDDQPVQRYRPQAPVNVYVQAPPAQQYYAPPPPPQPVYEEPEAYEPPPGPPQSTYVVVQGIPPTLATGYWPRGFQPMYQVSQPYPVQRRYYYYRPY